MINNEKNMEAKFKIDDYVKHVQTREVYKVIEVIKGAYQFFYRLETDEDIIIETPYPESVLEIIENNLEIND